MVKFVIHEAFALAALSLFAAMICLWAGILSKPVPDDYGMKIYQTLRK